MRKRNYPPAFQSQMLRSWIGTLRRTLRKCKLSKMRRWQYQISDGTFWLFLRTFSQSYGFWYFCWIKWWTIDKWIQQYPRQKLKEMHWRGRKDRLRHFHMPFKWYWHRKVKGRRWNWKTWVWLRTWVPRKAWDWHTRKYACRWFGQLRVRWGRGNQS